METFSPELLQIGSIGLIAIFAIKEVFAYLKVKKTDNAYPTIAECNLKHQYLNEHIEKIHADIHDINENHIDHIEKITLPKIESDLTRIFQILEDRLPPKK